MKVRILVSKWMPAFVWMILIFLGSSDALSAEHTSRFIVPFLRWLDPGISPMAIASIHMTIRKLGHFTEYAVLAALLWRGLRGTFPAGARGVLALIAFFVAAGFAASDEFHQSFVPTRTASARDVMIDCVGALVAVSLCAILTWRRNGAVRVPAQQVTG